VSEPYLVGPPGREYPANQRQKTIGMNMLAAPGMKWCPDCDEYNPLEDFGKGKPYCKTHTAERGRAYNAKRRDRLRAQHIQRKYGINAQEFDALLESQGGVCPICETRLPEGTRRVHVDHCHDTGEVRGILCNACNSGLGMFGDNPERLLKAIAYLR
jgi:hypothetical protein